LRNGQVQGVVATSALELGIDIGGMDAAVLIGYPGSIAATLQQAGRAGRKSLPSLAILVASANAMDQYLASHPSYFFERSPERALIAPNNLLILLQHIRCAAFELPFQSNEGFGAVSGEKMGSFLKLLSQSGELHEQGQRYFWMSDQYPAAEISLRNASPDQVSLITEANQQNITIGQVDLNSAYWMVHPEAVYLHEGVTFFVEDLDPETGTAHLKPTQLDYYTQAISETQVEIQKIHQSRLVKGGEKSLGEINVTNQVTGYRKIRWFTHEQLGQGKVELPETSLNTIGYWIMLNEATINQLKENALWSAEPNDYGPQWDTLRRKVILRDGNRCQVCSASGDSTPLHVHHIEPFKSYANPEAANQLQNLITLCPTCHRMAEINVRIRSGLAGYSYLLHNLAPLLVMCDGGDIGVHYDPKAIFGEGKPSVILYDNIPGGLGLSESLYERHNALLDQGYETINNCACADGCPSCVGPIGDGGSGGKQETLAIFKALIDHD
jgi:DEAD/DEAH box helicase domain-containing protein